MKEIASKNDPGDYYGMKFPYTKDGELQQGPGCEHFFSLVASIRLESLQDMLVEMGPEWLTQATPGG